MSSRIPLPLGFAILAVPDTFILVAAPLPAGLDVAVKSLVFSAQRRYMALREAALSKR